MDNRIRMIDALRGLALAGIGIVHFGGQYLAFMPPANHAFSVQNPVDGLIEALLQIFIVGKGFGLFSLMFGLSFALQMQRAERRDPGHDFRRRFAWRLTILFAIGYVHSLFFSGDILTVYALLGIPMLLFYRVPDRWLLVAAALLLLGTPRIINRVVSGPMNPADAKAARVGMEAAAVRHWDALAKGNVLEIVRNNGTEGLLNKWDFQMGFGGRGYQTFALFLIGLWAGRRRLFENAEANRALFKRVLRWTAALFFAVPLVGGGLVFLFARLSGAAQVPQEQWNTSMWPAVLGLSVMDAWNNVLTIFYVAAFALLFLRPRWRSLLVRFESIGRVALSSYLMQTAVGAALFYGIGFGLLGRFGNSVSVPIGLVVVAAQVVVGKVWLEHFRFGPVEWLWRSLTWLRWQPFRIKPELEVAQAA